MAKPRNMSHKRFLAHLDEIGYVNIHHRQMISVKMMDLRTFFCWLRRLPNNDNLISYLGRSLPIFRYAVSSGLDICAKDSGGWNALRFAEHFYGSAVCDLLKDFQNFLTARDMTRSNIIDFVNTISWRRQMELRRLAKIRKTLRKYFEQKK